VNVPPQKPDGKSEKLAKFMARCGVASRRVCEQYIRARWVEVDGEIVSTPETRIVPDQQKVVVRGKLITPPDTFRYILLNKPTGIICTCKPSREKGKTILDLVTVSERVFPVGRLDKNTSGLILLTNDGELAQRLTHPSFGKEKEYLITTKSPLGEDDLEKLRKGVQLEDGLSRFTSVQKLGENSLKVVMTEGRNRQIRRTLKALRIPIKNLHRTRFGDLTLSELPRGKWRDLTLEEIERLKSE